MKIEGVIKQLESIADHTERMLGDPDADEIWEKDIEALKFAITALRSMLEAGEYHLRDATKMVPLSLEQLREVPHGKIKDSTLQNIGNRANEIASPPARIDRSKWTTKNITDQHPVDQFICSECGAIFEDFSLCKIDEDSGDKEYYEYELKFCPACGRAATKEAWAELERRLRLGGD